jgi:hypothetical protein
VVLNVVSKPAVLDIVFLIWVSMIKIVVGVFVIRVSILAVVEVVFMIRVSMIIIVAGMFPDCGACSLCWRSCS